MTYRGEIMLTIKQSQFEHVEVFVQDVFKEQAETYFDELRDKEEERLTLAAYGGTLGRCCCG